MADVSIQFDNSYGVFVPGHEITGTIVFTVTESPLKARAVIISVHGQGRTHWTVSERHTNTQSQTTHRTVTYSGTSPYAESETVVWSPPPGEATALIPLGTHQFTFKFLLPHNCAPSFEGTHGYIRYYCKAKIDRPWKLDYSTKQASPPPLSQEVNGRLEVFTVVPPFDLNLLPSVSLPLESTQSKQIHFLFFKEGEKTRLNKGGFVPGENIDLHTHIENHSWKRMNKMEVKLVEVSHYTAYRNGQIVTEGCAVNRSSQQRIHKRRVNQIEKKLDIQKGSHLDITLQIPIPPVVPTFNLCPIIRVEYFLKIKATTKAAMWSKVSTQMPVFIGTIPLRAVSTLQNGSPQIDEGMVTSNAVSSLNDGPPSYEECVFGAGTIKDEDDNKGFAPRYAFYPHINPTID